MKHADPAPPSNPHELPGRIIGRYFLGAAAAASLACAVIVGLAPSALPGAVRAGLVAALLVFAALNALALRSSPARSARSHAVLIASALAALALAGLLGAAQEASMRSVPIGFSALIVCVVGAIVGRRGAIGLGVAALAQMTALAWAEASGWISGGAAAHAGAAAALAFQAVIVLCGVVGAVLIGAAFERYVQAGAERERRFRSLLGIAAEWYWEQDAQFRFTQLTAVSALGTPGSIRDPAGAVATLTIEDFGLSDDELDAHRADLESNVPFRGLLAHWRDPHGSRRTLSVSGEPRFDASGAFRGYWGVARDVTDGLHAQRAAEAVETRYHELFTRSPSPLFLHRHHVVFEANDAAARLFGFADAHAMEGFDITRLYTDPAVRDRAMARLAQLEGMAIGAALPVADFPVHSVDGRPLSVQATAVRVDTASGPANLSICYDITARQAVETALRRSEAMLSQLFATSPDCIAMIEMASGRHAMVNPAFCRVTGYSAAEVVGATGGALGLWHDPTQFGDLLARLRRGETVLDLPAVFVTKSGARVSMLLGAGRFVMDRRDYLVVNARDVTESERTRQQHAAILERASIGIAFTRDFHFVQANPHFERMFGWPAHGLVGQSGAVVWPDVRDHVEIGALATPLLDAGRPFQAERRMRRRDGTEFWCRLVAQAVDRTAPGRGGTIWIAEDVTERRRLDAALATARDDALAASRAKSAFLANTSHEIRTPLNGLLGLTRLAMQPELPEARRQSVLGQVLDSAQNLAAIMSDILDVSKIEAGKVALDAAPFALHEVLTATHRAYLTLAEGKGLALGLHIDAGVPATVLGDAVRLRQILANFITNAIKFTERGEVRVGASATPSGALRLTVADTGPGIEPAVQAQLFVAFSQGDSSTTRRFGGTGLGLSICRQLAELMGGTVGVESVPGQGSTFWAELPLPAAATPGALPCTELDDTARLLGARVLMVEDNSVNMTIAVAMLEHWGVRVSQAEDGRVAITAVHAAAAAGQPFNGVLMDVQMPVMGGHEAARELRRHYSAEVLPIIALTAAALVSEREQAAEAGMNAFLTKPIDAPVLRHTLARHVTAHR